MGMVIVVEGGGSHTQAALYDDAGTALRENRGGPSNPAAYGVDASARCIASLARQVLGEADSGTVRLIAALAGASNDGLRSSVAAAIGVLFPAAEVRVTSDLYALLYANAGEAPGVLVIAGTGAAVLAQDDSGTLVRTGGWGTLFGDEGSSYAVVQSALRACARALDGVAAETALTRALPPAANLNTFSDFIGWQATATKRDVAALAPGVAREAENGDPIARACIEEEARRLAALAVSARERLGLPPKTPLFEYGGLLEKCGMFRTAFREAVGRHSDMQPAPCPKRGLEAVFRLSCQRETPSCVAIWTTASTPSAPILPDTESASAETPIDSLSTMEFVRRMHLADEAAVAAVTGAFTGIAEAVEKAARSIRRGARIIYAGAGTSGRLGVLDASECPPTFGVPPDRVCALIAGGDRALRCSVEGAEDDADRGAADLESLHPQAADFVVGIAASGTTPYVDGVLSAARAAGAPTALITSNRNSPIAADLRIVLETGPEVLAGSTRLKAGTATKLALNMISTGAFTQAGFVYQGRMVGMTPANEKLRGRAARIVSELSGVPEAGAAGLLEACGYHIGTAILMARQGLTQDEAAAVLENHGGNLREALSGEREST